MALPHIILFGDAGFHGGHKHVSINGLQAWSERRRFLSHHGMLVRKEERPPHKTVRKSR